MARKLSPLAAQAIGIGIGLAVVIALIVLRPDLWPPRIRVPMYIGAALGVLVIALYVLLLRRRKRR